MAESVTLPQAFIDEMVAHARADEPNECCGVIVRFKDGRLKLLRTTNEEASPWRFNILPVELLHIARMTWDDAETLVIYHSHTQSEARPSATDSRFSVALQEPSGLPYWLLVSLEEPESPSVRIWRMRDGEATELELAAGVTPTGSSMVRLKTADQDGKQVVSEIPIE